MAMLPSDRMGGPAHGLTAEEVRRRYARSRAAQGLSRIAQDGTALDQLAALLRDDAQAKAS